MLNNIKTSKSRGFTIVELLIVIVVIGILAAITIVAYNGITNRAKLSKAQSAAALVVKKAEAYNADGPTGAYPTTLAALTGAASTTTYAIPTGTVTLATAVPGSAPANESTVLFYTCGTAAGVRVGYWDYQANAAVSTASTYTAGNVGGTCTLAAS
jgi:prepilin-type N-terminal cleavage/methylation domain-containing protein